MAYLNSVTLMGDLGKDPEVLKETDKGKLVRLQLATEKKYRNAKSQKVEDTQWHTIYLTHGVGKFAETYLKKGDKVLIRGELKTTSRKDKEGVRRYTTFVFGRECKTLSSKDSSKQAKAETEAVYENASDLSPELN